MTVIPITGQGSGATATATQSAGAINATNVTAAGSGYAPGSLVTVTIAGSGGGSGFAGYVTVASNGTLPTGGAAVTVTAAGTGYAGTITVTLTPATGGPVIVSSAGIIAPATGVAISSYTGTVTLCVDVESLTANKSMQLALELSTDAFSTVLVSWVQQFIGQIGQGGTSPTIGTLTPTTVKRSTIVRTELPYSAATYFGVASAVARIRLQAIEGSAV